MSTADLRILEAERNAWLTCDRRTKRLIQQRVDRGARLLDGKLGTVWPFHMNLARLNLASDCSCVLGQLAPDIVPKRKWLNGRYMRFRPGYTQAFTALSLTTGKARSHGFQADDSKGITYLALAHCWRRKIEIRGGR